MGCAQIGGDDYFGVVDHHSGTVVCNFPQRFLSLTEVLTGPRITSVLPTTRKLARPVNNKRVSRYQSDGRIDNFRLARYTFTRPLLGGPNEHPRYRADAGIF